MPIEPLKGRVVLVPFPFDDLSASKVRPAVCLTEPVGEYRHVVLAFVTSVVPPADPQPTDVVLDPSEQEAASTGLKKVSAIRLHRLLTVSTSMISRELGSLSASVQEQVDDRIAGMFGLGRRDL